MGDIYLEYKLNLKTGFFRSEEYTLMINREAVKLIPENRKVDCEILLRFANIMSINILAGEPEEIEIRTDNDMYVGTFCKAEDISEAVKLFKMILGKRFVYN